MDIPVAGTTLTKTYAPWTNDLVVVLNGYQNNGGYHPYTCPNRNNEIHENHALANGSYLGLLEATPQGWLCPVCKYTQDWVLLSPVLDE